MKAVGLTCGVGSMLIGARQAGFKVVGNAEWRPYYHTGTFEHNFKSPMTKNLDLLLEQIGPGKIELAMGHPECGNYSNLRTSVGTKMDDPGDIPLFIDMLKKIKPDFFVMDNLPGSLVAVPVKVYSDALPEYDLFPEWISNYHYGNTQKFRKRFFLIGAKKKFGYVFHPGEFDHGQRLIDVIGDLPKKDVPSINHIHWTEDQVIHSGWAAHQLGLKRKDNKITYGDLKKYLRGIEPQKNLPYLNLDGEKKTRPGYYIVRLGHHSPVLTGGGSALDNHYREDTLMPFTQRERARIQGCPDDFIFQPLTFMKDYRTYAAVYKQIGKFMPVQFCRFVSKQIADFLKTGKKPASSGRKLIANDLIDGQKKWLCSNVKGYRRRAVCESCEVGSCEGRMKEFDYR